MDEATNDEARGRRADVSGCTVPFDETTGCGLEVERLGEGTSEFIRLTVVTRHGSEDSHDLSPQQAARLRQVLDEPSLLDRRRNTVSEEPRERWYVVGLSA